MSLGVHRPTRLVTNEEVAHRTAVPADWIEKRSGIVSRRFCGPDESLESMAVSAGTLALTAAGISPAQVDCVILATSSYLTQTPPLAPRLAHLLGTTAAGAFDLKAACAGFSLALTAAADYIRAGSARLVLVIGAEQYSSITDHTDRSTAMLFADGAGAAVVGTGEGSGIGPVAWGSDCTAWEALTTPSWLEFVGQPQAPPPVIRMDGRALLRSILRHAPDVVGRALAGAGVGLADLAAFIPHQANGRIIDMLAEQLGLPGHVVIARDVTETGNTSAASIPLAIEWLLRDGSAKKGDLALLFGFGAGLTYAGQLIELPGAVRTNDSGGPS
nr:beta-ketoacyl-ACP synthase 3 [Streptomyces boncukensis]